MAKISANTITDGGFSRVAAPTVSPSRFSGAASHIGAALGAGAKAVEVENEGIRDLTRQRIGNIEARSREMRGAVENLGRGVSGMLKGFDSALDKRADEEAEAAMGKYRLALLAGQAEDDATPVKGSLSAGLGDADAMARADGPYNAVRRRMSAWNDTDDYRSLSARARRKFEEKRREVDRRFGERALEKHIAADLARRKTERGAAISAKISEASAFARQHDANDVAWMKTATEAIDDSVRATLEDAHALNPDGTVVEGAEKTAAQIRAQMADMVFSRIFGELAASLEQTNDQGTADKLRLQMYALCGAKAGIGLEKGGFNIEGLDKKQLAEIDELFKASAKGYEFSDAAAKKGWADFGKAWEARDRRLERERHRRFAEAERLEWEIFAQGDGRVYDGGEAMAKRNALLASMSEGDRKTLRDKVDSWHYARNVSGYAERIDALLDADDPATREEAAKAIEAEVKGLGDTKLKAAVRKMLAGVRPGSVNAGPKYSVAEIQDEIMARSLSPSDAQTLIADRLANGEVTNETYRKVEALIRSGALDKVDRDKVFAALKEAGLDLEGVLELDKDGRPVMKDGHFVAADPEGMRKIHTFTDTEYGTWGQALWSGAWRVFDNPWRPMPDMSLGFVREREHYAEITNKTLARVYELAAEYEAQRATDPAKNQDPLADFLKKRLVREIGALDEMRLRQGMKQVESRMAIDAAANRLHATGRTAPAAIGKKTSEE